MELELDSASNFSDLIWGGTSKPTAGSGGACSGAVTRTNSSSLPAHSNPRRSAPSCPTTITRTSSPLAAATRSRALAMISGPIPAGSPIVTAIVSAM